MGAGINRCGRCATCGSWDNKVWEADLLLSSKWELAWSRAEALMPDLCNKMLPHASHKIQVSLNHTYFTLSLISLSRSVTAFISSRCVHIPHLSAPPPHFRYIQAALVGLPPGAQLMATSASNVAVDNIVSLSDNGVPI